MRKMMMTATLAGLALAGLAGPGTAQESEFGPADATETYYWVSNKANLPLFVQYD
jgi:ribose transport system substrate-binding protein